MKNLRKCSLAFAVLFSCSIIVQSFVPFQPSTNTVDTETRSVATATENTNIATYYFYNQLSKSPMAKKFYNALVAMEKEGLLKSGTDEYDLIESGVLTEEEVMRYINNADSTILVAFGAARDAFIFDNPSLFYVNADNFSVTIGTKSGKAYATLGTGRDDSYSITEEWKKKPEVVQEAIDAYQKKVKEIAEGAKTKGESVVDRIAYVNEWLCNNVEYSFCEKHENGKDVYPDGKLFCDLRGTAYGSLINGKGVCESFARGFKAVMDELNIPCVLVYGTGAGEPHMWNYVQIDSRWYAIDTTWNNTSKSSLRYYLKGKVDFEHDHISSGILSDFEFVYPQLSNCQYGVSADKEGFVFKPDYVTSDDNVTELKLSFSYNGKSISKLYDEGIYVAFRYIQRNTTVQDIVPSPWLSAYESQLVFPGSWFEEEATKDSLATFNLHPGMESIQFMLVTKAPDDALGATDPDTGEPYYYAYKAEEFNPDDIIEVSNSYTNDAYGTYFPAPGLTASTPGNYTTQSITGEFIDCKLTFSENLVPIDEWEDKNDSGVASISESTMEVSKENEDIISTSESAIEAPKKNRTNTAVSVKMIGTHADINEYAEVKDVVWDPSDPKVVSFKFKASPQFKHTYETYTFYVCGLVGDISGKGPGAYILNFSKRYILCPKVFNDGRDYIVCYGEPQIVANEDLSTSGWKDEEGNVFSASQRSQMMLVVNDLDPTDKDTVLNKASELDNAAKILQSATYEIDLQICKRHTKIPDGSYVQVSIGFPDGMKYEDFENGSKTLKMYHYVRGEDGQIDPSKTEEVNLTVTPYGLVAKITSFSPFAVVVYDGEEVPAPKRVSASVLGKGGTISGTKTTTFGDNKTITYTLKPNEGYQIDKVLVNEKAIKIADEGNEVAGVKVGTDEGGYTTLTFSENELESINTLVQASFVAQRVIEYEKENEIVPVQKTVVLETDEVTNFVPVTPPNTDNPEVPSIPTTPEKPEEPSDPDTPTTPEDPEEPSDPDTPTTPEEPEKPSNPDTPTTPEEPEKPSTPNTPSTPSVPVNPSTPSTGNSGNSGSSSISNGNTNTQITKPEESDATKEPETTLPTTPEVVPSNPTKPTTPDIVEPAPSTKNFNNTKKPKLNTTVKKNSKKVSFEWDEIDGADGYKIYQYDTNTGKYKCIKTITDPTKTTFSKKMKQASSYLFKVRAFTIEEDGSKTYGKYSATMKETTPPNTVKGLKVKSEGAKVTLSWKKVKNADGYQIFSSKKKNGAYSRVKTVKKDSLNTTINKTDSKTYYYKVRAFVKDADDNRVCGSYGKVVSSK